jgi:hypothetical protein
MTTDEVLDITITLGAGPDSDERELDELTSQLRRQLLELDVESVEAVRSEDVPAGAKPVDVAAIGALAVSLAPNALKQVMAMVEQWVANRRTNSVKVVVGGDSIELANAGRAEQEQLVQMFVEKHGGG